MNIALIKYGAGNVRSVQYALNRLGVEAQVTDSAEDIQKADKVIFPGVGEASTAMRYLSARNLVSVIKGLKQPVLGICLGMQLLCKHSEENDTNCLGVLDLQVRKFPPTAGKIPQIGWNTIYDLSGPLTKGISENEYVYFVHSYYVEKSSCTVASANYGLPYSAALQQDNFFAAQFHPEKSADTGQRILANFLHLEP